jgi:hypothetical protein
MNVKIGTEVAQFPKKEYINGIFVPVRNTLGDVSLWYWTDCCTVQTVLAVHSHVPGRPAARQIFSYRWGAAGWGE